MLAMLVVATALTLIGRSVHTTAWNEDQFDVQYISKLFHEDDMTPEFTEQLSSHDHTSDVTTRRDIDKGDKYGPSEDETKTLTRLAAEKVMHHVLTRSASTKVSPPSPVQKANGSDFSKKTPRNVNHEDIDIVDREDHVTQYLSDHMVNTDSEITCLQASEPEDESGSPSESNEVKADKFFNFLTGLEEAVDVVDSIRSRPNTDDYMKLPMKGYPNHNAINDEKYKD